MCIAPGRLFMEGMNQYAQAWGGESRNIRTMRTVVMLPDASLFNQNVIFAGMATMKKGRIIENPALLVDIGIYILIVEFSPEPSQAEKP